MATQEQYDAWDELLREVEKQDPRDVSGFGIFMQYLKIFFPWTHLNSVPCPSEPCPISDIVAWTIVHLNDHHGMPREEIASWLELTAAELGGNLDVPLPVEVPMEPGEEKFKETE